MPSPAALNLKRHWPWLLLVPLATGGAGLFLLMRTRANDPGLVAAEILGDMVAGRGLGRRDIRDDRGNPLTNSQKDRLCFDIFHPALKGTRIVREEIVNFENGTGSVKAVLVDDSGRETIFMLPTIKGPDGVIIHVSTLLRPLWEYQTNPTAAPNVEWGEKVKLRGKFVRDIAPKLEAIGIKEIKAEDGEYYPVAELAGVYENWE